MPSECKSYFATSVEHREIPMSYLGVFGLPGQRRQFVSAANGDPVIFRSQQEAEIAAFRILLAKLNRALRPQEYVHKPVRVERVKPVNTIKAMSPRAAAEALFKKG